MSFHPVNMVTWWVDTWTRGHVETCRYDPRSLQQEECGGGDEEIEEGGATE